ncbi:hypothetical protein ANN_17403 [Periplaneta americana]|uniref:Uncharacterized protein n=1 Tax=Periplaneta americana TaxID=6978 RepID=A0ABQ8SU48_PERAM|nr:hypothetical protein ANN_17403 [Periplaneta americana]
MCSKTRNVTYAGFVVIITVIEQWSPTQSTVSSSSLARSPAESRSRADMDVKAKVIGLIDEGRFSTARAGERYRVATRTASRWWAQYQERGYIGITPTAELQRESRCPKIADELWNLIADVWDDVALPDRYMSERVGVMGGRKQEECIAIIASHNVLASHIFATAALHALLDSPIRATYSAHLKCLALMFLIMSVEMSALSACRIHPEGNTLGWAPGANPNSKQGRLIFIRYGINAARCSAGKKGVEEKSWLPMRVYLLLRSWRYSPN